jgi:hypothetical protein
MSSKKDKLTMIGLIPSTDTAQLLGRDLHTLAVWRGKQYGPTPRRKIGSVWFYNQEEVERFAKALELVGRKPTDGA